MTNFVVGNTPDYNFYQRKNGRNYASASELYLHLFVTQKAHIADIREVQTTATIQGRGTKRRRVDVPQRTCNTTQSVLTRRKLNGKS
jgi:hypothetical protein